MHRTEGFTLLEVLIGIAILTVVSTAIYFSYANVIQIVQAAQYNSAVLSIIETKIETVRNMRYEDVGTVGGVPAGKIPQTQQVALDNASYTLEAYVRNIDDPFDGTLGGAPGDTAPADYKLLQFQVRCPSCARFPLVSMSTYVAPKNLESASKNGNLFVRVFDASGQPIAGATVHVTNTKVSPAINLTDITNSAGILALVDTATSSAGYHIVVSKAGYSGDQTYPPGGNPANPVKPDATVASQQLTITSLAIDRVSPLTLTARDSFCAPAAGMDLLITGGKLIGTAPDVPKYSVAQVTGAGGVLSLPNLEWDTYTLKPTDTVWDIAGIVATSSLNRTIDPNTSHSLVWQVASRSANGLLVSVAGTGGNLLNDATVRVTGPGGYDRTVVTGRGQVFQTDWSGDNYASQSGGILTDSMLHLDPLSLPPATGSPYWLISKTFDLGSSSVTFDTLNWGPTSQPPLTIVQFQLAANNDNSTWNFVGPDGTAGSYFASQGQVIPSSLNGNQYLRYKVFLQTPVPILDPTVQDVTIAFTSGCIIPGQAYFNGLGTGTYTVTVTRSGYSNSTTTKSVTDPWQRHTVTLSP